MIPPLNLKKWIEDNRSLLKPPVGNQVIYKGNDDFIVMVVGGPNARKDFHYNEGEELFYQLEGNIQVKLFIDQQVQTVTIHEGEMFLLPPKVPHCPVRPANTVGLVIERYRKEPEMDACIWYCENCSEKLYEEQFPLKDIVVELPKVMQRFYSNDTLCTCKKCGLKMDAPQL